MNITLIRSLSISSTNSPGRAPAQEAAVSRSPRPTSWSAPAPPPSQSNTPPKTEVLAVVMDWAGTTIDHLSTAPAQVFINVFKRQGITVGEIQARGPMGTAKRDHIATVLAIPSVASQWQAKHGRASTDQDINQIYHDFLPLQKEILSDYSTLIPGAREAVQSLREKGLRIGSTTGYTKDLMSVVLPLARQQGYDPDVTVCSDEVIAGRPGPWQLYEVARQMNCYPLSQFVKVDDTSVGITAGINAGCWTVAVSATGNEMRVAQLKSPNASKQQLLKSIEDKFKSFGAHYVIESIVGLPAVVADINSRLARGESPA
jgi:phosphonoacetaldehyde hydrolase